MKIIEMIIPETICRYMIKLKNNASCVELKRHSYLYLESDPSETVYIIEQGMMMITKLLPDGQEVGIMLLSGINLLGHCEVLSNIKREHRAMALTQCKLWELDSQIFLNETHRSGEFSLALARLQNERLRQVEKHIGFISQNSVTERLTKTLLEIAHNTSSEGRVRTSITPCPTHQDLATMIASTRETVSVIMGKLRKQNIISFDRKELKIINEKSLQEFIPSS